MYMFSDLEIRCIVEEAILFVNQEKRLFVRKSRARLNPLAKEFVPFRLNPLAKEFIPLKN